MNGEMREILFRAKHIHALPQNEHLDGTWVYGYLCYENYINTVDEDEYGGRFTSEMLIDPETVCQYTGLSDKNGRKIFERDIVKAEIKINDFSRDSVKNEINTYEVSYHEKYCYFYLKRKSNNLLFDGNWSYYLKEIEVIGNIFDNPELIGGQP